MDGRDSSHLLPNKARALIDDPVDFESTWSTRGIQHAFDPMPRINPRRFHSKRTVEHSPTR